MARKATGQEILALLRERSGEVRTLLGEPMAQLSMPIDGKGLRIVAAVPHPRAHGIITIRLAVRGEELEVPVQISGDFEHFRALA